MDFINHIPVLTNEVLQYLAPKANENFIDCTFGFGGHTNLILEKNRPNGKVLGIEIDEQVYQQSKEKNIPRLILENSSYINLKSIAEKYNFQANGILFDLGMSSWHVDSSGRGFSFQKDEPLIMCYAPNEKSKILNPKYETNSKLKISNSKLHKKNTLTAEEIINLWTEKEIKLLLQEYGQERFSGRIARNIVEARKIKKIETTSQLAEIIKKAVPFKFQHSPVNPATQTFQALRIVVNSELENISQALPQALEILPKGGRIVVISFHSLEDKIIKNFFRDNKQKGLLQILTKKPITPSIAEISQNKRARSAKLRVAIKL